MAGIFKNDKSVMKKITIFGAMYSQHVSNFAYMLKKYADYHFYGVNKKPDYILGKEYYKQSKETFDEIYELPQSKIWIKDVVQRSLLAVVGLFKYSRKTDIVQFHAITPFVLPLAVVVKLFSKAKISSFIYGSEFLRANTIGFWCIAKVFSMSDSIVCDSTSVLEKLKDHYPSHKNKMNCCYFGSAIIDKLIEAETNANVRRIDSNGKKVIMCGYNGTKGQQHLKILNNINDIAKDFYWVFPITYYNEDKEYIKEIRNLAESKKLDFIILDSFLTEEEWASYIFSTDIFIHMQISDAFSSSISEHLLLGHILINGSWLTYKDLEDNGVFYISSDFDTLEQNVKNSIAHYKEIESKLKSNKEKIIKMKSLDYSIKNYWIPYFENI